MENRELAQRLRDLRDFLIIAGYEESHATRYTQIARYIEKLPESVEQLRKEGRLEEIPGVGKLIKLYIKEILETGVSSKQKEWEEQAPYSVVDLVRVPGLGPKTARNLFLGLGIDSRAALKASYEAGSLNGFPGIGPKMLEAIRTHLAT